jgi:AcrR family transcriptional regulator
MRHLEVGRSGRGDRTQAALVHAALDLFGCKGIDQTSIDEITATANVTKGTFYAYFYRKQDVLLEGAAQVVDSLTHLMLPMGTPAALRALGDRFAAIMTTIPRPVISGMIREIAGHREDWVRVLGDRRPLNACIKPIVEAGQAAGELRTDQSPTRLAQALTVLWLDNVIGWAERPKERPLARDLALATTLFLEGTRA